MGNTTDSSLESLVAAAKKGDGEALETVVREIQDTIYGLALRMLFLPSDAEDATQEILIRVVTHLGGFRGQCAFKTWVYRVASNHLLSTRKRLAEQFNITFESASREALECMRQEDQSRLPPAELALLLEEVRISCVHGMLLCLDRGLRIAFVLAEVFQISGTQGAAILEITPAAFRQRLSRSRQLVYNFMRHNCALIKPENPCQCRRAMPIASKAGWFDAQQLPFTSHRCRSRRDTQVLQRLQELGDMQKVVAIFRSTGDYAAPGHLIGELKQLIQSKQFRLLEN